MLHFSSFFYGSRALRFSFLALLVVGWCWAFLTIQDSLNRTRCHNEDAQERRLCYRDYYRLLTEERGAKVALTNLIRRDAQGDLWNQCHELVHQIGQTAGKSGRALLEIFTEGSSFCRAGYYHGVLAEVVRRNGEVPKLGDLTALCDSLPGKGTGTGLYRHCTHGVGHGLMFATQGDVFVSLQYCDAFSSEADQKECAGGVFMEHFMADGVEHVSKQSQTPIAELCTKSPMPYTEVCYERAGTQFASDTYQNPEKSFLMCLALSATLAQKEKCIAGIGLIAVGEEDLRPRDPSLYCAHNTELANRKTCYHGAITTMGKVAPELGDSKNIVCGRVADLDAREECLSVLSHESSQSQVFGHQVSEK